MKIGKISGGLASLFSVFLPSVNAQLTDEQQALVQQAQAQAAAAGAGTSLGNAGSIFGTAFIVSLIIGLAIYAYFAMALMTIAKKTNTPRAWMAWVPIADLWLMKEISQEPLWTFIVMIAGMIPVAFNFLPIAGWLAMMIMFALWAWKICLRMNRPAWWAAILALPFLSGVIMTLTTNATINMIFSIASLASLVLLGMLAWGGSKKQAEPAPQEETQKIEAEAPVISPETEEVTEVGAAEPSVQPEQPAEKKTISEVQQ